jgi:lysophospholipase L1-like esterase
MNHNKKVVTFTVTVTFLLLLCSFIFTTNDINILSFKNINVISDIVKTPDKRKNNNKPGEETEIVTSKIPVTALRRLGDYVEPRVIMRFGRDTTLPALPHFTQQLSSLRKGKKTKIRIGWFGDSMIEGDLLTQTFRKRMQKTFGGYGVGFVPAQSITAQFRITVRHHWKGDWKEESFKDNKFTAPLYLSGHTYFTGNGTLEMTDATVPDSDKTQKLQKTLICGELDDNVNLLVNGSSLKLYPSKIVNTILLDSGSSRYINLAITNEKLPVYGVSFEPASGVVVDNFSFRGITGIELIKLDSAFLAALDSEHYYDLVVIEYGANLMFRPNDKDYSWYKKYMERSLARLRRAMPHTEFLLISTADRAFRYNGEWQTAVGIDSLVKTQATLAYDNNMAFYNMFSSMGGAGTIVSWVDSTPSLANQDYVHPNHRGAEVLGNMLYDDFMKELNKEQAITKPN